MFYFFSSTGAVFFLLFLVENSICFMKSRRFYVFIREKTSERWENERENWKQVKTQSNKIENILLKRKMMFRQKKKKEKEFARNRSMLCGRKNRLVKKLINGISSKHTTFVLQSIHDVKQLKSFYIFGCREFFIWLLLLLFFRFYNFHFEIYSHYQKYEHKFALCLIWGCFNIDYILM